MSETNNEESEIPDARCFFFPLPLPIPIEDGVILTEFDGELKRAAHLHGTRTSVRIHQTTMQRSVDAPLMMRLMEFTHQLIEGEPSQDLREPLAPEVDLTIAEVVVPVARGDDTDSPLDLAIEAVRRVQRATMLVTMSAAPYLTRQRLPFIVPVFNQILADDGTVNWGKPTLLTATDTQAIHRLHPSRTDPIGLDDLEPALGQVALGGPFIQAHDMRVEAQVHLRHHGDYRASVLSLAAAYEVLLDSILMSMLWEEGDDPSVAPGFFGINGMKHTKRVLTSYAPRLKGGWAKDRGVVGQYLERVVNLRQRIMHAGYAPTELEAEDAHEAGVALEKHISSRLRSPAIQKNYPRTAVMYCGTEGLQSEGALLRATRDLLADEEESWWFGQHERWADWASRFVNLNPPIPGADPAILIGLIHVTLDEERVFVLDPEARAAAAPSEPQAWTRSANGSPETLQDAVDDVRDQLEAEDEWQRIRIDVNPDDRLIGELIWQRDYELLTEHDHRLPDVRHYGPQLLPHQLTSSA